MWRTGNIYDAANVNTRERCHDFCSMHAELTVACAADKWYMSGGIQVVMFLMSAKPTCQLVMMNSLCLDCCNSTMQAESGMPLNTQYATLRSFAKSGAAATEQLIVRGCTEQRTFSPVQEHQKLLG